ncbi:hypothetical protein D3C83_239440 [compost metagenome]
MSVKNDDPNRFVLIVRPSCTNEVNSNAWNPRNVVPAIAVAQSHSFDEPRILSLRVRLGTFLF